MPEAKKVPMIKSNPLESGLVLGAKGLQLGSEAEVILPRPISSNLLEAILPPPLFQAVRTQEALDAVISHQNLSLVTHLSNDILGLEPWSRLNPSKLSVANILNDLFTAVLGRLPTDNNLRENYPVAFSLKETAHSYMKLFEEIKGFCNLPRYEFVSSKARDDQLKSLKQHCKVFVSNYHELRNNLLSS